MIQSLQEFIDGVTGNLCWAVIGGAGSGSVVSLRFGKQVRFKRPLRNASLSLEERIFDGERSLIVYCAWRITFEGRIVCSAQSINDNGELNLEGASAVKNDTVQRVTLSGKQNDLEIGFKRGATLSLFCDVVNNGEANYVLFNPTSSIWMNSSGEFVVEERREAD